MTDMGNTGSESERLLHQTLEYFQGSDQSSWDGRVRSIIITKLEEAMLWHTQLDKPVNVE